MDMFGTMSSSHGKDVYTLANVLVSPESSPCQNCKKLVPDRTATQDAQIDLPYVFIDEYPFYPALQSSNDAGCGLCGLLRYALCFMATSESRAFDENGTHFLWDDDGEDGLLKISWDRKIKITASFLFSPFKPMRPDVGFEPGGVPPQYNGMVTRLRVRYGTADRALLKDERGNTWRGSVIDIPVCDSPDLLSNDPTKRLRLPSPSSLSDESVTMMQQWITDCKNTHGDGCSIPVQQAAWTPTRLLEIHASSTTDNITLRLVESSNLNNIHHQKKRFAALSHMWGDMTASPPLRTFKSNLEKMKKEIKLSDLPLNFADAIHVCVRLNIKYLWIDSLCIVQDSPEDWKYEARLMHLVYQLAEFTIVATSSTSCHDGFLYRDIGSSPAVKVPYSTKDGGNCFMIMYYHKRVLENNRVHAIDLSKWNTRGWTMQERSLSTRSIHFGHGKIFFECRQCFLSEENNPEEEFSTSSSVLWPRGTSISKRELNDRWENFVVTYCDRKLTRGTDKLPAIESVAAQMASQTGYEYISSAGVWRHNINAHLLWHCWIGKATVPKEARAPSWSWAALDASIVFSHPISEFSSMPARSQAEWISTKLVKHPFRVLEVVSDPILGIYLKASALTQQITGLKCAREGGRWRKFLPYDVFVIGDRIPGFIFAHARLDLEGDSSALHEGKKCIYVHLSNHTRCTGLILEAVPKRAVAYGGEVWKRVGVASLFSDETGSLIHPSWLSELKELSEIIVI